MVRHVWKEGPKEPVFTPTIVQFCRYCRKTKEQLAVCDKCGKDTVKAEAIVRNGEVVDVIPQRKVPHFDRPMKRVDGEYVVREA
jgi:primosomal protein N'